ncbi:hypothetical protein ACSNN9_15550, partial [Micromonospora sp. URMC 107]|uniref:hypothetical protein n=1 Tax=Micromonospora sp. URMC 107 TaxID=3423418 RepID=UPI003F196FBB
PPAPPGRGRRAVPRAGDGRASYADDLTRRAVLVAVLGGRARWLRSRSYDEGNPSTRWRAAFLDVEHRTLFCTLNDH